MTERGRSAPVQSGHHKAVIMRNLTLLALAFAAPAAADPRPIGTETVITFAGGGGLRDWQRGGVESDTLFVRDRTEQWYRVTLTGPCRFDRPQDTLSYTTDTAGTFDRFSQIRVARYPEQLCGVKSIRTSLPPAGRQGRRPKK